MIFEFLENITLEPELTKGSFFIPASNSLKLKLMSLLTFYSSELPAEEFYQLTEGSDIEQVERSHSSFVQD